MDPLLGALGISAGSRLLGGLFGGGKQQTTYQMSPEARQLYNLMMGQMGGRTPGYLTDPITQRYGALRKGIRERMPQALGIGSGLETTQLMRATGQESRVLGNVGLQHRDQLMRQLTGLVSPRGQTTTQGTNWGNIVGGMGGDINFYLGMQAFLKQMGQGGGGTQSGLGWTPPYESSPFRFGRR